MEGFFDAPLGGHGCASLADLQQQLRQLLDSKVTPAKAEHVSVTFELRSNVTFAVPVTEAENASLEAGGGVDPRLFGGGGGARAGSTVMGQDGQLLRQINALDTVRTQSQDDPVVQRIVSKHIMAGVGEADQSQWIMRSMTRGREGWTFAYGCKDSAQMWARQNAKNPAKTVVGEWSNKDGQDPVNLTRPAFDCRGALTIAFSKSEKAISVKYEHTNMHKTVGELLDILAPPPPRPQPIAIENRKSATKKTPKKRQAAEGVEDGTQTPGEEGATPRPKKRKKSTAQDGDQPSTQKKRPRKKKKDDDAQIDPALDMLPPEMPGARPVGDSAERQLYNTQARNGAAGGGAYPDGLVSGEPFNGSEAQASAMVASSIHENSILNLPPGEAQRRREAAIRLLADSNVDPKTLSAEQFSIFANQSPGLQQESLAMLVKYGAERLRIVLPDKDKDAATNSTSPSQSQTPEQGPAPAAERQATAATDSPKRKRKASRKKAEADGTDMADDTAPALTQTDAGNRQKKTRAPRLSRGACTPCRAAKLKCGKEKPSCEHCLDSGTVCLYPFMKPRKSKAAEDEAEEEAADEQEQEADTPEAAVNEDDEPDDLQSPGFRYEDPGAPPPDNSANHADVESGPMQDNPQSTYGEPNNGIYHHSSGLTFPDSLSPEMTQQMWNTASATDYNQSSMHGTAGNGLSLPQQIHDTSSASTSHNGAHQQQKAWGSYTTSQRSGAVDVPTTTSAVNASVGQATVSWPPYSAADATSTKQASASPRQSRRTAKATSNHSYSTSNASDGTHHGSALAQAAMNNAAARTASPVQTQYDAATISRAKSRQSVRPQTRTPVPSQPSRQPQRSALTGAANTSYSTVSDKSTAPAYNNSYSQYSTNTDQTSNNVAYQPYSQQNTTTTTNSTYPSYDSYGTRSNNTAITLPLNSSTGQNVASSYTSSTPSTANQWGDTSSKSRNTLSHTPDSSTPASSSLNLRASNPQRSQIPPSFNVRPQAPTAATSRANPATTYGQGQHTSYNSYSTQPQQQSSTNQQQTQGWYTGSSTSGYSTAAARGSTGTGTGNQSGSHNSSAAQYGQQQGGHTPAAHHAMNLSGHAYNSMDYSMMPGGAGH